MCGSYFAQHERCFPETSLFLVGKLSVTYPRPPPTFSAVGGPPSPVPEEPVEKEKTVDPWLSWWIPGCGVTQRDGGFRRLQINKIEKKTWGDGWM